MKRLLCLVAVLWPALARADDTHYQNFLPGERAAGMGGAYTAIADDPSGTYYNPAGLVDAQSGILSVNLNFYGFQQQSLDNAFHTKGGGAVTALGQSVGAAINQLNTVPGTAGTVHGIGAKDEHGHYKHAWALSVLIPDDSAGSATTFNQFDGTGGGAKSMNCPSSPCLESLSQTNADQTALIGLGYALRYNDQWSFGISANGIYRQVTERSRSITAPNYPAAGNSQTFFEDDYQLKLATVGLYLQAGAMYRVLPQLTLGATLATPSITVYGNGSTDEVLVGAGSPGGTQNGLTEINRSGLNGDSRLPFHGRVGAAYRIIPPLLLVADFSLWTVVHYGLIDNAPTAHIPIVTNVTRLTTFNINVGAEYKLNNKYPLRAGFFTNRSSAPGIDPNSGSSGDPALENVDLYGFTLGFTLPGEHTESTFGVVFSFGNGESKTPTAQQAAQALNYTPTSSSQLFLDIYAGGSYRF